MFDQCGPIGPIRFGVYQDGPDFYFADGSGGIIWTSPFMVGLDLKRAELARVCFVNWCRSHNLAPTFPNPFE